MPLHYSAVVCWSARRRVGAPVDVGLSIVLIEDTVKMMNDGTALDLRQWGANNRTSTIT